MPRLIDADALIVAVLDHGVDHVQTDDLEEINQIINDAPTIDAVPVVRCSKCVHGFPMENGQYTCNRIKVLDVCDPDYFCADGKRKEDAK